MVLTFAHTLGEFGVVLMIGGNIPGVTTTVSIQIYDFTQSGDYAAANQTALLLMAISFLTLSTVFALNRKDSLISPVQMSCELFSMAIVTTNFMEKDAGAGALLSVAIRKSLGEFTLDM